MTSALPRLTLRFDPAPGEAPASYLSRLAMRNGANLESFAVLIGIDLSDLIDGAPHAIEGLAQIADTDPRPLRSASFSRVSTRSFERNGNVFPRHAVRSPTTRICPDCLREDARGSGLPHQIGMAFRSNWQVPFLRACPRHNRALVEVWTDSDRTKRHDFATRIGLFMPQVITGALDTPSLPVSPFEQWPTFAQGLAAP